jgi:hypothetical protein
MRQVVNLLSIFAILIGLRVLKGLKKFISKSGKNFHKNHEISIKSPG